MGIEIPPSLGWLRAEPGGPEWLAALPTLVTDCAERWGIGLGDPFEGHVSYAAPGKTNSGAQVVLKINFPHPESEAEAAALRHWNGHGAVRLLDADDEARALLLERCLPGTTLWEEAEGTATEMMLGVFERLWDHPAPDAPFQSLANAAEMWGRHLADAYDQAGAPFEADLLNEALIFMRTAERPRPDDVVLHQDLHGGNVLRRGDDWVVVDPKPLVGEREFDLTSYIRDRRPELAARPDAHSIVQARLDHLTAALGLDRERARGWALAHALAWGFDTDAGFDPEHVVAARLIAGC